MVSYFTADLIGQYHAVFGAALGVPKSLVRAPGRVNLIGEHTDYNHGWVLPMAIDRKIRIACSPNGSTDVKLFSLDYKESGSFNLNSLRKNDKQSWINYPQGVAFVMQQAGFELRGFNGVVAGDVPIGSGLSSSAAFEVASALAFSAVSGIQINDLVMLARMCQKAENEFVGMKCGIMDQYVSLFAQEDCALLIDCMTLEHKSVALPHEKVSILVCDTGVKHELVATEYNARRAECEKAVALIASKEKSVKTFRDITPALLKKYAGLLGDTMLRRARHVVTENQRVMDSVDALGRGDIGHFGKLIDASHESLRDDFEVSCAELDTMVELARKQKGTFGARMVGGGFGGCTVNLVEPDAVGEVRSAVAAGYKRATGNDPATYVFRPAQGAGIEEIGV
jgi:galactokinase